MTKNEKNIKKEKIKVTLYFKDRWISAIYNKENITFDAIDIMRIFRDFNFEKIEFKKGE